MPQNEEAFWFGWALALIAAEEAVLAAIPMAHPDRHPDRQHEAHEALIQLLDLRDLIDEAWEMIPKE